MQYPSNFGFADEHDNLIGYVQLPDATAARSWALDWLDQHPEHDHVQVWEDASDEEIEIVRRR